MKTTDEKFALIVFLVFCGIFIFMINYMEGNRQEIKTLKAENLEILKTQKVILNSLLKSKKTEIKLLYFQLKTHIPQKCKTIKLRFLIQMFSLHEWILIQLV